MYTTVTTTRTSSRITPCTSINTPRRIRMNNIENKGLNIPWKQPTNNRIKKLSYSVNNQTPSLMHKGASKTQPISPRYFSNPRGSTKPTNYQTYNSRRDVGVMVNPTDLRAIPTFIDPWTQTIQNTIQNSMRKFRTTHSNNRRAFSNSYDFTNSFHGMMYEDNTLDAATKQKERNYKLFIRNKQLYLQAEANLTSTQHKHRYAKELMKKYKVKLSKYEIRKYSEAQLENLAKKIYSDRNRNKSAKLIQKSWRSGKAIETNKSSRIEQVKAAIKIQKYFRKFRFYNLVIHRVGRQRREAAIFIQYHVRCWLQKFRNDETNMNKTFEYFSNLRTNWKLEAKKKIYRKWRRYKIKKIFDLFNSIKKTIIFIKLKTFVHQYRLKKKFKRNKDSPRRISDPILCQKMKNQSERFKKARTVKLSDCSKQHIPKEKLKYDGECNKGPSTNLGEVETENIYSPSPEFLGPMSSFTDGSSIMEAPNSLTINDLIPGNILTILNKYYIVTHALTERKCVTYIDSKGIKEEEIDLRPPFVPTSNVLLRKPQEGVNRGKTCRVMAMNLPYLLKYLNTVHDSHLFHTRTMVLQKLKTTSSEKQAYREYCFRRENSMLLNSTKSLTSTSITLPNSLMKPDYIHHIMNKRIGILREDKINIRGKYLHSIDEKFLKRREEKQNDINEFTSTVLMISSQKL